MNKISRYRSYSEYLRLKYPGRALRVAVDGGFSCPNRSSRESAGCIYCDSFGARASYLDSSIEIREQVARGTAFLKKRYKAEIFLLYFQAFTGTYGGADYLKKIWDYALSLENFRELIVSTRPDCIDEEKADLLASYKSSDFDVWVELGLQSSHDKTLLRINRGHTVDDFENAYKILKARGIRIAVHLISGLPGESSGEMLESVRYVSSLKPEGIKFHNLHVAAGTELEKQYLTGELSVPSLSRHILYLSDAIGLLPPETVIMRLTCDTPAARRLAPKNDLVKGEVIHLLNMMLEERDLFQGKFYSGALENYKD